MSTPNKYNRDNVNDAQERARRRRQMERDKAKREQAVKNAMPIMRG